MLVFTIILWRNDVLLALMLFMMYMVLSCTCFCFTVRQLVVVISANRYLRWLYDKSITDIYKREIFIIGLIYAKW